LPQTDSLDLELADAKPLGEDGTRHGAIESAQEADFLWPKFGLAPARQSCRDSARDVRPALAELNGRYRIPMDAKPPTNLLL
jgi:hypothetical protein